MRLFTSKLYFKLDLSSTLVDHSEQQLTVKGECVVDAPVSVGDVFAIKLQKNELVLTKQPGRDER